MLVPPLPPSRISSFESHATSRLYQAGKRSRARFVDVDPGLHAVLAEQMEQVRPGEQGQCAIRLSSRTATSHFLEARAEFGAHSLLQLCRTEGERQCQNEVNRTGQDEDMQGQEV